ncbi:hypothetical protein HYN59_00695 [Flavobacterium album]|uniref:TonB C-terminal domain-containing protein n=1 Tax=Flavobacterium album TaxID=2175091 RepID=A0A2S1QTY4_9FLAO|nr:energy transducer TonB [Flavobacterium album]AWH83721.1 hypothetical protein HYN59_00695 [Flavobacterium album]
MKKIFLIALFSICTNVLFAQEEKQKRSEDTVYAHVQLQPEFPGGMKAFYKYISDNFKPNKGGKMLVTFVVEADGSVTEVKIVKGINAKWDKKLYKIIENSPKWEPGSQDGKPIRASYRLPLTINLN